MIGVVENWWEHVCAKRLFILIPNTDMESGNETEEEDKMALAAVRNRALYVIAKQLITFTCTYIVSV